MFPNTWVVSVYPDHVMVTMKIAIVIITTTTALQMAIRTS